MKPSYNKSPKKPAGAGAKRSYTKRDDKPAFSKDSPPKRSYTKRDDKPAYNDKGPAKRTYTKRDEKPAYNDRGPEKRSYVKRDDKPAYNDKGGEKRTYTKRDDKPAYNDRGGEKRSYTKRDDKPAYNDRGGEKRSYTKRDDKPAYNDRGPEKRSYVKRDDKPAYNDRGGEKRRYAKRDDYNAQNAEKRIYSKRGPDYNGAKAKTKPANENHESRSYERKPRSYDKADQGHETKDKRQSGSDAPKSYDRKPGSYNREPKVDNRQQSYDKRNPKGEKRYETKDERQPRSYDKPYIDNRQETKDERPAKTYDRKPTSYDNREKRHENKPYDNSKTYDKPNYSKAPKAKQPKGEDEVRLNRYLSNAGIASRRDADKFIAAGLVKVNGKVVTEMGVKVKSTDEVIYNNEKLSGEKKVYFLMNKPKDYITTNDDPQGRKTVLDLVKNFSRERVFPVGRLDRNTTGTLLLTNDGDIAQRLSHPKFGVKKVYKVGLDKNITPAILKQLRDGIELEDGPIQPDVVDYMDPVDKKIVGVEIHSGRNRIVRRMFESVGYEVIRLDRLVFAGLDKKGLKRGEIRHLTEKEVSQLRGL